MTFRSFALSALLLGGVAVAARHAGAEPSAADLAGARQAFETAVALEAEQKWIEAEQKLRQALAVKDTPGLRFHLAHCEAEQGLLLEASLEYDRANELLRQGAKAPDVQKLLTTAGAELKRRIPHVTVEIPDDVPAPIAELDGKAYAPSELALGQALNPGAHRLKVSAHGRNPFESAFSLKEGEQITIRADLRGAAAPVLAGAASPAAPSVEASTPALTGVTRTSIARHTPAPKLFLMLGESAVTVAGLAVGIGYSLAASSARDRVQTAQGAIDQAAASNTGACSAPGASLTGPCADLRTAIDDHDRDATVSTVGFVCAAAGTAALLTTWLAYPNRAAGGAGATLQPVVALGRIGVLGRF